MLLDGLRIVINSITTMFTCFGRYAGFLVDFCLVHLGLLVALALCPCPGTPRLKILQSNQGSWKHRYALLKARLARAFKKVYPYANAAYLAWMLSYQILYLYGKTRYFNPWLHFMRLEVTRMTMGDYVGSSSFVFCEFSVA